MRGRSRELVVRRESEGKGHFESTSPARTCRAPGNRDAGHGRYSAAATLRPSQLCRGPPTPGAAPLACPRGRHPQRPAAQRRIVPADPFEMRALSSWLGRGARSRAPGFAARVPARARSRAECSTRIRRTEQGRSRKGRARQGRARKGRARTGWTRNEWTRNALGRNHRSRTDASRAGGRGGAWLGAHGIANALRGDRTEALELVQPLEQRSRWVSPARRDQRQRPHFADTGERAQGPRGRRLEVDRRPGRLPRGRTDCR